MDDRSPSDAAEEWINYWSDASRRAECDLPALEDELPREWPDICLQAIVQVLARIDISAQNELIGLLAAGPLEELLVHNGTAVLEDVNDLARREAGFRLLLDGVWGNDIDGSVRERLAKHRRNPW